MPETNNTRLSDINNALKDVEIELLKRQRERLSDGDGDPDPDEEPEGGLFARRAPETKD